MTRSVRQMARDERMGFAAFLDSLTPQQWDSPTLCDKWTVRDVAIHTISFDELSVARLLRRLVDGQLNIHRINAIGIAYYSDRSTEQITALIRANAEPHGLTGGFGGRIALTDGIIHQQDIRRSIGIPRTIDPERLRAALDFARFAPPVRGAWRARGVRLVATDLSWAFGKGQEVRGSGEALLMTMAGRRASLADLEGPGKATLAQHI